MGNAKIDRDGVLTEDKKMGLLRAIGCCRPGRGEPQTDTQSRVRYIESRVDKISQDHPDPVVKEMAYLVGYLAAIIEKHLRTGEK